LFSRNKRGERRASPRVYRLLLTMHIIVSVGWLGIVFAKLVLGLRAMTSNAPGVSDALYLSMGVVNIAFPPAAIGTLVTGVLLSMDTKWGLLQHYWVATKLALSVGGDRHRHRLGGPPYPTVHLRAVGAGGGVQHDTRDRIGADDSSDPCRWPTRSCWGL
jgi:hypothetical protein